MLMGVKSIFIDTNILVYASNIDSLWHSIATTAFEQIIKQNIQPCISTQVLREYFAVATRGTNPPPRSTVINEITALRNSCIVLPDSLRISNKLFEIVAKVGVGGRQIHDANIVATMQIYRISHLLTHNVQDFNRFHDLITIVDLESFSPNNLPQE